MEFALKSASRDAALSITSEEKEGVITARFKMTLPEAIPEKTTVSFDIDSADVYSAWSPAPQNDRKLSPNWSCRQLDSKFASWPPIYQVISQSGKNRMCVALSDPRIPAAIYSGIREEDAMIAFRIEFFTLPTNPISEYSCDIRIDMRDIPYYDAIYEGMSWMERVSGCEECHIPEHAMLPMDSLWYSFHQNLTPDEVLRECALSKKLGMETVIIDDGWQTDDSSRGYAYCGDWEAKESKVGDMKTLVDGVHALGMKLILWYSVPFVGVYTKHFERFKGMFLEEEDAERKVYSLDPRYKKVREYLVSTYVRAKKEWGLDGFKLDFIDSFILGGRALESDPARDFESLEDGIDALLSEIKEALTALDPDIMIEFRQTYIGPCIRKFGNMLRVWDCPADATVNRSNIIDMRYTSGGTPVHSDMLMWSVNSPVEAAATQFASAVFAVPQVSVKIWQLPEEHRRMIKFYLDFWRRHRDVLIGGKLTARNPEYNYSSARSRKDDTDVLALYDERIAEVENTRTIVVNASANTDMILKNASGAAVRVVNCMGEPVFEGEVCGNLYELEIPVSGIAFIDKK